MHVVSDSLATGDLARFSPRTRIGDPRLAGSNQVRPIGSCSRERCALKVGATTSTGGGRRTSPVLKPNGTPSRVMEVLSEVPASQIHLSNSHDRADREAGELTQGGTAGVLLDGGVVFRDTFTVRWYEVGTNRRSSIETIANLLQEAASNHGACVGFTSDGLSGRTPSMKRQHLTWVVTRLHIQMDEYPSWGDVVEVDTWFQWESSILSRRDWVVRLAHSGRVIGRATSSWVCMNEDTRRLSRIPEEMVNHECRGLLPEPPRFSTDPASIPKIPKLEEWPGNSGARPDGAILTSTHLRARRSDLDMNQHVNNVTYIAWMLESLPSSVVEKGELAQITIEYRRECHMQEMVESLARLHYAPPDGLCNVSKHTNGAAAAVTDGALGRGPSQEEHYVHLLRLQEDNAAQGTKEITKGYTVWRCKQQV